MENNKTRLEDSSDINFDVLDKIFDEKVEGAKPEPEVVQNTTATQELQSDPLKDTNDLALAALYLKEKGLLHLDGEVKKLTPEEFALKLEETRRQESEEVRKLILESAGEYKNYFDLKLNGIPDEVIEQIANDTIISKIKLDILPDESHDEAIVSQVEKNREKIISEELKYKGISEDEIPIIIEGLKNKGMIPERAKASKKFFDTEEDARAKMYLEQKKAYEIEQTQYAESIRQHITEVIDSKNIGGYTLDNDEAQGLKEFISKRKVPVTYLDENNNKVTVNITEFDRKLYEYQENIENQIAFALWLFKGGSFTPMKNQGQIENKNKLFDELRSRSQKNNDTYSDSTGIMDLINNT